MFGAHQTHKVECCFVVRSKEAFDISYYYLLLTTLGHSDAHVLGGLGRHPSGVPNLVCKLTSPASLVIPCVCRLFAIHCWLTDDMFLTAYSTIVWTWGKYYFFIAMDSMRILQRRTWCLAVIIVASAPLSEPLSSAVVDSACAPCYIADFTVAGPR